MCLCLHQKIYSETFIAVLFIAAPNRKQPNIPINFRMDKLCLIHTMKCQTAMKSYEMILKNYSSIQHGCIPQSHLMKWIVLFIRVLSVMPFMKNLKQASPMYHVKPQDHGYFWGEMRVYREWHETDIWHLVMFCFLIRVEIIGCVFLVITCWAVYLWFGHFDMYIYKHFNKNIH